MIAKVRLQNGVTVTLGDDGRWSAESGDAAAEVFADQLNADQRYAVDGSPAFGEPGYYEARVVARDFGGEVVYLRPKPEYPPGTIF